MQNFEKGHFFPQESKNFLFVFHESPNAQESKSMIGFVSSAQQLTLQSSKVQNCQNRGQLLFLIRFRNFFFKSLTLLHMNKILALMWQNQRI